MRFFISRQFLITFLAIATITGGLVFTLFSLILPNYTRHGKGIVVPNVYQVTIQEAEKILSAANLTTVVQDCTYLADLPPLMVISQRPVSLSRVKRGRTVYLTLNKRQPTMVVLPKVVDLSLYHAQSTLESWKFEIGEVSFVPDFADNIVLRSSIKGRAATPGDRFPLGTKIDLVVGRAYDQVQVEIPNLIGYTYEEALQLLQQNNLILGSVVYNPSGPENLTNRVFAQSPRAGYGDSIRAGYPIDIFIYGATPESQERVDIIEK